MPIVVPLLGGRQVERRYIEMIIERLGLEDEEDGKAEP